MKWTACNLDLQENTALAFFEERTWEMRAAVSTLLTVLMHSQPTWGCLCFISEEAHVQTHVGAEFSLV